MPKPTRPIVRVAIQVTRSVRETRSRLDHFSGGRADMFHCETDGRRGGDDLTAVRLTLGDSTLTVLPGDWIAQDLKKRFLSCKTGRFLLRDSR